MSDIDDGPTGREGEGEGERQRKENTPLVGVTVQSNAAVGSDQKAPATENDSRHRRRVGRDDDDVNESLGATETPTSGSGGNEPRRRCGCFPRRSVETTIRTEVAPTNSPPDDDERLARARTMSCCAKGIYVLSVGTIRRPRHRYFTGMDIFLITIFALHISWAYRVLVNWAFRTPMDNDGITNNLHEVWWWDMPVAILTAVILITRESIVASYMERLATPSASAAQSPPPPRKEATVVVRSAGPSKPRPPPPPLSALVPAPSAPLPLKPKASAPSTTTKPKQPKPKPASVPVLASPAAVPTAAVPASSSTSSKWGRAGASRWTSD